MTKDEIVEEVAAKLGTFGYPMQSPYADTYADLFLEAFSGDGPTSAQLSDTLSERGLSVDEQRNLEILCEAWSHWWTLLKVTLPRRRLVLPD